MSSINDLLLFFPSNLTETDAKRIQQVVNNITQSLSASCLDGLKLGGAVAGLSCVGFKFQRFDLLPPLLGL